ncbi:MAG: hypothetical protein WDZ41_01480 [Candidatus Babeliales bacterium]
MKKNIFLLILVILFFSIHTNDYAISFDSFFSQNSTDSRPLSFSIVASTGAIIGLLLLKNGLEEVLNPQSNSLEKYTKTFPSLKYRRKTNSYIKNGINKVIAGLGLTVVGIGLLLSSKQLIAQFDILLKQYKLSSN